MRSGVPGANWVFAMPPGGSIVTFSGTTVENRASGAISGNFGAMATVAVMGFERSAGVGGAGGCSSDQLAGALISRNAPRGRVRGHLLPTIEIDLAAGRAPAPRCDPARVPEGKQPTEAARNGSFGYGSTSDQ